MFETRCQHATACNRWMTLIKSEKDPLSHLFIKSTRLQIEASI